MSIAWPTLAARRAVASRRIGVRDYQRILMLAARTGEWREVEGEWTQESRRASLKRNLGPVEVDRMTLRQRSRQKERLGAEEFDKLQKQLGLRKRSWQEIVGWTVDVLMGYGVKR